MLRLQVDHTWGQIGINRTPGRFEMQTPQRTLDLQTTLPRIKVEGTLPRVTIDQSRCFAEAGLKKPLELTAENAQYSQGEMLKSIGRIAEQGNALTDIHINPNAIPDQGYANAYEQFMHEFNMDTIPKSRPKIDVVEGTLDIQVQEGQVENRTVPRPPSLAYQRGAVEVYLKQRPHIETRFLDVQG